MSIDRVREVAHHLLVSTGALAAFGAALELQITSATVDPKLEAQIREVLHILNVDAELEGVGTEVLVALLAEIRITFLQGVKLLYSSTIQPGWTHTEEELLQSQGQVSAAFAPMFQRVVIPQLDGLAARLEAPTASFLDVGVGVAALSIAMARLWPALQVVGIDPWEPALALARQRVAAAGLGDRIELRRQAVEDLAESAKFDLVWFSPPFIRADQLTSALQHVWCALRPGGWIVSGTLNRTDEPLAAALADLRSIYWGGQPLLSSEFAALLEERGFDRVQVLPSPSWAIAVSVVGRRPL
jgi:2-polyprenyl-3-methyl-5-hydroxy-6-metoxy-1,4-benzoquinol methylase